MERRRVGLALGGGVARGSAHIGVLKCLEHAGIPIDVVAGTSIGSVIGACYSAGISADQMEKTVSTFTWRHIARPVLSRQGFVSFAPMEDWLVRLIGDVQFSDLVRPFVAVASDLASGEPHVLGLGRVAPAVHASSAVPGLVVPVELDGRLLCDGGISCNLPAGPVRALGADFVIGVDLMAWQTRPTWGPPGYGFSALENMIRRSGGGLDKADCLITPDLKKHFYLSFQSYTELIAEGEAATEQALPAIRAALGIS